MRNLIMLVAFLSLLLLSNQSYSQKQAKIKFGVPNPEEVQMKTYAPDTSATAVILYKKGYFNASELNFRVHVRIKILKAAGLDHANFTLPTSSKSEIEGRVYNLENGQTVITKVEKGNIYKEDITKERFIYKVFPPNVKAGSVVDIQYSHDLLPMEWHFQSTIPVLYNELTLEPSTYIQFKKTMYGFATVKPVSPIKWIAERVPPIVEESFMPHYSNYVTHFKFDIESISIPGRYYKEYTTSWQKVASNYLASDYFGGVFKNTGFLNDKAREIRESSMTVPEKIDAAYKYIRENIKWNGRESEFVSEFYREAFNKSHTGNAADVNMMLISLLKKAGITTHPVIMSTRANGLLNQFSASTSSLNYVIGYVDHEGTKMVVDACMRNGRPGILPTHCLNLYGLAIDEGYFQWLDLSNIKTYRKKQYIAINISKEGEAIADVTTSLDDYAFLEWMDIYDKQDNNEEKMKVALAGSDAEMITEFKVSNLDKTKLSCQEKRHVDMQSTEYFQQIGNEYIVTPFVMVDFENPFNSQERLFPIDFKYPMNRQVIVSLTIPENMSIKEIPQSASLKPKDGGAKFTYLCNVSGNRLNIKADLIVEQQFFQEDQYLSLKNFFSEVHKLMSTAIQLDKKI